ncbi:hypothetical protein ABW19_dt0209431 [Dactylella cylindrospora]|nr:hypothetical protein ABW19_dt0209431 [Dactylella cylindrospora]
MDLLRHARSIIYSFTHKSEITDAIRTLDRILFENGHYLTIIRDAFPGFIASLRYYRPKNPDYQSEWTLFNPKNTEHLSTVKDPYVKTYLAISTERRLILDGIIVDLEERVRYWNQPWEYLIGRKHCENLLLSFRLDEHGEPSFEQEEFLENISKIWYEGLQEEELEDRLWEAGATEIQSEWRRRAAV